ncbi:MAG: acyl carrier protein [Clostridiales bacterium]|nr:acyl carrier protein [Clostridiales bacterium]
MEQILEILEGLHPEVDFETCKTLIDDKIIDSFDIVTLISDLSEEFDVNIPVEEIIPENFNSAKAIHALIERLLEDE